MSGAKRKDNEEDDGIMMVLEPSGDTRTFPERVYDMVTAEDREAHGLVSWEDDGRKFSMARDSACLSRILEKHFGKGDETELTERLRKYGWEMEMSSVSPGTHMTYRNGQFCRGMGRSALRAMKRKRKSSGAAAAADATRENESNAAAKPAARKPPPSASIGGQRGTRELGDNSADRNSNGVAQKEYNGSTAKVKKSNPQDGSFESPDERSVPEEANVDDAPGPQQDQSDAEFVAEILARRSGENRQAEVEQAHQNNAAAADGDHEIISIEDDGEDEGDSVIEIAESSDDEIKVLLVVPASSAQQQSPVGAPADSDSHADSSQEGAANLSTDGTPNQEAAATAREARLRAPSSATTEFSVGAGKSPLAANRSPAKSNAQGIKALAASAVAAASAAIASVPTSHQPSPKKGDVLGPKKPAPTMDAQHTETARTQYHGLQVKSAPQMALKRKVRENNIENILESSKPTALPHRSNGLGQKAPTEKAPPVENSSKNNGPTATSPSKQSSSVGSPCSPSAVANSTVAIGTADSERMLSASQAPPPTSTTNTEATGSSPWRGTGSLPASPPFSSAGNVATASSNSIASEESFPLPLGMKKEGDDEDPMEEANDSEQTMERQSGTITTESPEILDGGCFEPDPMEVANDSEQAMEVQSATVTTGSPDRLDGGCFEPDPMEVANDSEQAIEGQNATVPTGPPEILDDGCVEPEIKIIISAMSSNGREGEGEEMQKAVADVPEIADEDLIKEVEQAWKEAQKGSESKTQEALKRALQEKRTNVMHEASKRRRPVNARHRVFGDRLSATNERQRTLCNPPPKRIEHFKASLNGNREKLVAFRLDGSDTQQPRHNSPISLRQLQYIEDDDVMRFVPFFFEDDDEKLGKILTAYFDTKQREQRFVRGAIFEEENTNIMLDRALERIWHGFYGKYAEGQFDASRLQELLTRIAGLVVEVTNVGNAWFKERFELFLVRKGVVATIELPQEAQPPEDATDESQPPEEAADTNQSPEDAKWGDYLKRVDTYRSMFCARCFTYDCSFHGRGDVVKPCLDLQYEKGIQRTEDEYWKSVDFTPSLSTDQSLAKSNDFSSCEKLTGAQEALCHRMFLIFNGDVAKIAAAVRAPKHVISDFIHSKNMQLPQRRLIQKRPQTVNRKYTSMKNYNPVWLNNMNKVVAHPWCVPCSHTEACSEASCFCVKNGFFCSKTCAHAEYSPNFYRGCECKAKCVTSSCSCFAANRECDPDLCKSCGACTDPPNTHEKTNQRCHNDNMSMRRHRRLLIGESTIAGAGWGLFTKDPLKKGDFIQEYLGELISHEEGERRGNLYDHSNSTYLFTQSTTYEVDAKLKGNKSRFGNHSDTPNVQTKKMFVNGNVRIGFFAKQNIKAQSELFINYRKEFKGEFMNDTK